MLAISGGFCIGMSLERARPCLCRTFLGPGCCGRSSACEQSQDGDHGGGDARRHPPGRSVLGGKIGRPLSCSLHFGSSVSRFRNASEPVAALQSYGEESRRAASTGEDCQAQYSSAINPVPVLQLRGVKVAGKNEIVSSRSMKYLSLSLLPPPQETHINLSNLV